MAVSDTSRGEHGRGDQERRATVRLVHYWQSLRRNSDVPAFVDFDPHRNPVPWDNCLLASCRQPHDVIFEHVGAGLVAVDPPASGRSAAAAPEDMPFVRRVARFIPVVQRTNEVQHLSDDYRRADSGIVLYRAVLLPFRGRRPEWSYILGAVTYRIGDGARPQVGAHGKIQEIEEIAPSQPGNCG